MSNCYMNFTLITEFIEPLGVSWFTSHSHGPEAIDCAVRDDSAMVVWVDYMKYGVLSKDELNNTVSLVHKALSRLPDAAVGFVIGPNCSSDRRGGMREELRLQGWKVRPQGLPTGLQHPTILKSVHGWW